MRVWGDGWKILRVNGVSKGYQSQPRQDLSHNGDGTTKESKRSAMPQRKGGCVEPVHFEGNEQVFTFLLHAEKVL